MVVRHLVRPSHATGAFQNPPNVGLRATGRRRNVAHPRRPEPLRPPEQRRDDFPSRRILCGQPYLMGRESDESAVHGEFVRTGELFQSGVERSPRQHGFQRQAQFFTRHALKVRVFQVMGRDLGKRFGCEPAPWLGRKRHPRIRSFEDNEIEGRRELIRSRCGKRAVARKDGKVGGKGRRGEERGERGERIADRKRRALRLPFRRTPLPRWGPEIEEDAPAQRTLRRYVADDKAIHGRRGDRPIEHQLNMPLLPRLNGLVAEQDYARAHFRRAVVETGWKPLTHGLLLAGQEAHEGVDAVRRRMENWIEDDIAASNRLLLDSRTREVERAAITSLRHFGGSVLRMHRPNTRHQPRWADPDPVAHMRRPRVDRPCHHNADAGQREDSVDCKTEARSVRSIARDAARRLEMSAQRVYALPGRCRDRKHMRIRERRPADHRSRSTRDLGEPLMRGEVRFRERHNAAVDA
jgi:hypothetical protein